MAPAIIISSLHPYFKPKESENVKRPKIQTSPYLASVTLDPETSSLGKIFLEMMLNFRTLHPRCGPANSIPCQSPHGPHSRCRGGGPRATPQTLAGPCPARRRALGHSVPSPLLLCPQQISYQRGPTAEGKCHTSSVSRMAAQLGGGGSPCPGEPRTDPESRADGDSDSVPASNQSRSRWCFLPGVWELQPPASPTSSGFLNGLLPRGSTGT